MKTEFYSEQINRLPASGRHLIGHQTEDSITVYQAFNPAIADYAVRCQQFGGSAYSFNRMSWIKPGFLWMMYRSGWAMKENQERILAIRLAKEYFNRILSEAVISSFDVDFFPTQETWRQAIQDSSVRLQWDPDHDPYGGKLTRKAIQIGMSGDVLREFCTNQIKKIADITDFVKEQRVHVFNRELNKLQIPFEEVINVDKQVAEKSGISLTIN